MSAPKTLFQKIADKEVSARLVHEDALCVAFHDISPQAPVHVLIVPRKPIPRVAEATAEDQAILGHLLLVAGQLSRELGLGKGFRVVINNGPDGGETVPHLHVHLLGGRALGWPPG
jgi:histidine triad (HIT) family protein